MEEGICKEAVLRMTNKEVAKKPWLNFSLLEWVWILTALLQKPAFLPGPASVSTRLPHLLLPVVLRQWSVWLLLLNCCHTLRLCCSSP